MLHGCLRVWLRVLLKILFIQKNIKIIFKKKLFLTSVCQNNLKTSKNINLKKNSFFKILLKLKNKQAHKVFNDQLNSDVEKV
jgi:hypothetical protein